MTPAEIERYLINSGLLQQSIAEMRPAFPRWLADLEKQGVTRIPASSWTAGIGDALACNLLAHYVREASPRRDKEARAMGHNLRNLTGRRPYKP